MKILSLTKIANITSRRKKKRKIPFLKEISPKIDGRFKEVQDDTKYRKEVNDAFLS